MKNFFNYLSLVLFLTLSINSSCSDSISDLTKKANYIPGGKYRLFGNGRGKVNNYFSSVSPTEISSRNSGRWYILFCKS